MKLDRRMMLGATAAAMGLGGAVYAQESEKFSGQELEHFVTLRNPAGKPIARYVHGELPPGEKAPSVPGTCFTHPVYTPEGELVTDLAPADHPHHRGVFCAWVEMDGEVRGDWWGWGAKAPKENRVIVNRETRVTDESDRSVTLRVINSWRAEETTVLRERLTVVASQEPGCHVLDYEYKLMPGGRKDVLIAQSPFGGFCYRARPRGELTVTGPGGAVDLPNSIHTKKEANWPASRWYDMTYKSPSGRVSGVAVMDHPSNPLSTWHVVRGIHMLNPCIVAEDAVPIPFGDPLYLRYRLVAHDGTAEAVELERLYEDWVNRP